MGTDTGLIRKALLLAIAACAGVLPAAGKAKTHRSKTKESVNFSGPLVLWREPADIHSRDLYYGPGGKADQPRAPFLYLKNDPGGTTPKFTVRDRDGVTWKVKLGPEARPETVATRLVWAVGYFTDEDYFLPAVQVQDLPAHLHRGQRYVEADGTLVATRFERERKGQKLGVWHWKHDPFSASRELNGLRVVMALVNNWDLKDINNTVWQIEGSGGASRLYTVSDLGATFGTSNAQWPHAKAKGNIASYRKSKFITKVAPGYINFADPGPPSLRLLFMNPFEFLQRERFQWIGKRIPRSDVRWISGLLAQLSTRQIRDAFRSAGYSPQEVDAFTQVFEQRIRLLRSL